LLFILSATLGFADLTFDTCINSKMAVLESLDIDPRFINDPKLMKIESDYKKRAKKAHFFKAMKHAYTFIPAIKEMITSAGIPSSILYLAMAESNFKTRAYSKMRASGMWQFMPYTGKLFGLKINQYVDERRDLIKSTAAAIKYLKHSQRRFKKWYLSAMSYNCGPGRVARAIRRAGTDDLATLLNPRKKYLPQETRTYIRKIVALALMSQDEEFMINTEFDYLMNRGSAYSITTIKLPSGERLSRVAKMLDMKTLELKKLNRQLKYDFIPPTAEGYEIYIPYIKLAAFKERYEPENLNKIYLVHTVKKGDSLVNIGKKYRIPYKVIKDFNKLKRNTLSLRQKLIIPINKSGKVQRESYMVRKGDSLASVSKKFRISLNHLKKLNSLTTNRINIGDRLIVID